MPRNTWALISSLCLTLLIATNESSAQTNPIFMQLGRAKSALYKPDSGPEPRVGIVVMHRESNYLNNVACGEFAKRGFMVLCMNSRFENSESSVKWELIPLDLAEGVNYSKNSLARTARSFSTATAVAASR